MNLKDQTHLRPSPSVSLSMSSLAATTRMKARRRRVRRRSLVMAASLVSLARPGHLETEITEQGQLAALSTFLDQTWELIDKWAWCNLQGSIFTESGFALNRFITEFLLLIIFNKWKVSIQYNHENLRKSYEVSLERNFIILCRSLFIKWCKCFMQIGSEMQKHATSKFGGVINKSLISCLVLKKKFTPFSIFQLSPLI